jgi:glycosyltransferase involved in cell wall biosynthesis
MQSKPRLLRITTASISLKLLLRGQFTFFQQHGFQVLTVSADGSEVKDLLAEGIAHQVVPMTRKITPLQDIVSLWKLIRVIHEFKPDIVHTHTPKAGLLGMIAARLCRVPVRLHTVAGLPLMEARGVKRWILKMVERVTYSSAHQVYPNSLGLLKYIKEQRLIGNTPLSIIGKGSTNGIDISFFLRNTDLENKASAIRMRYGIPDNAVVFGFVGRIVKDKGIIELTKAFKKLSSATEVRLILVGPFEQELDPLPAEVIQFINENAGVIKAGFMHDVRPWLMASDVFVFPSYREGFPNVVMQAACLEVPSIVSDINGCNELIEHEVSGLVVPPKNELALYEAMKRLAEDPETGKRFAKAARKFVTENFDQQYVWGELLKAYLKFDIQHPKL